MSSLGRGRILPTPFRLRSRWLGVALAGVLAAAATAGYSLAAAKRYEATATLVVAPVPASDPTLLGIDVLHDTDKRTAAATAARLIAAPEIAEAVRVRLGLRDSRAHVLDSVKTHVVPHSSAVAVTGTADDPARAAQLANAFVDAFATARTAGYQSEVVSAARRLRLLLAVLPQRQRATPAGVRLQQRLADLQALIGTADPTVRHGSEAAAPVSASWPHPVAWTIYAALIGLAVAALVVLLSDVRRRGAWRNAVVASGYDPAVSERVVERLEQRLAKRVEELVAERERLAAREASLDVREREVTAKLADVRAAATAAPTTERSSDDADAIAERERAVAEHERTVAARSETLEERELERARALEERERALVRRGAELRLLEKKLRDAEEALARRAQDVTAREAELRDAPAQPEPAENAAPIAPAPVHDGLPGWRLDELERLVANHSDSAPERAEEWQSYLFYLRDYTDASGRVPAQFDLLIEEAFGGLLPTRA